MSQVHIGPTQVCYNMQVTYIGHSLFKSVLCAAVCCFICQAYDTMVLQYYECMHVYAYYQTSSSAMAERPRELDQRFQVGYFSRYCDMTQFTLTHHMANKPFLLLGVAAEYRSRRRRRLCDKHCGRPSDVYDTDRRTNLTALETTFT